MSIGAELGGMPAESRGGGLVVAVTFFNAEKIYLSQARFSPEVPYAYERMRFSLAHEIAHILLEHVGLPATPLRTVNDLERLQREEWESGYLAAALLIDEHFARDYLFTTGFDIKGLAARCQATYHTAAQRAIEATGGGRGPVIPFRFIQLDQDGQVLKSYASDPSLFPSPAPGTFGCLRWATARVLKDPSIGDDEELFQLTELREGSESEKLLVRAVRAKMMVAPGAEEHCAVSLSCRESDAREYMGDRLEAVQQAIGGFVPARSTCNTRCPDFDSADCAQAKMAVYRLDKEKEDE